MKGPLKILPKYTALIVLLAIVVSSQGLAADQLELLSPSGGELDLKSKVLKYYDNDVQQVEARWGELFLTADYLEYSQNQTIMYAKGKVKLVKTAAFNSNLICDELQVDLEKELIIAQGGIEAQWDENTRIKGNNLKWDQLSDWTEMTGGVQLELEGWKITGEKLSGHPLQGEMVLTGAVHGVNQDMEVKAGKLELYNKAGFFYLKEKPVLTQGQNEMAAPVIVYDLNTKQFSAKGLSK